jgi:type VI secretion system secreted protein Hcp
MYLPNSDVVGETQDKAMKALSAWEINSFSFGAENNVNVGSMSGGGGAGKTTFKEFTITKQTDSASPKIFHNLCIGKHFDDAVIALRRSGGAAGGVSGVTFLEFKFAMLLVQDMSWEGSSGDDVPTETIVFQYGAMSMEYKQQDAKGAMTSTGVVAWSRVKNDDTMNVA